MSQNSKLVIHFVCGHTETTIIDGERSSQQNRNLWSRIKKWSSSTPTGTKHQQSASLCERCRKIERRQIEEAAELQSQMAANVSRQLAAQKRRLAAPPAQGVNQTIAALALPNDKAIIEALRSAQLNFCGQEELKLVHTVEWQGEKALKVQQDLDRVIGFWEKFHNEHAGRVKGVTCRSGPKFCSQCKEMETSLADPSFRRQSGLPDVKLSDGTWYGTDGIVGDPWTTECPFEPIKAPIESINTRDAIQEATPSPEAGPGNSPAVTPSECTLDNLSSILSLTSRTEVQEWTNQVSIEAPQSDPQRQAYDIQRRSHIRSLGLAYLKVQETRRKSQPEREPGAEVGNHKRPRSASLDNLDSKTLNFKFLGPNLDQTLRRLAFSAMARSLPPLPPQEEEELQTLESDDHHACPAAISSNYSPGTWIDITFGQSYVEKVESAQTSSLGHVGPLETGTSTVLRDTQVNSDAISLHKSSVQTPTQLPLGEPTFELEYTTDAEQTPSRPPSPRYLSSPDPPPINPFSPLGIQAIKQIRNYFHIPSHIEPSGYQEYFYARPRILKSMERLGRAFASRKSTPSGLLDELPWFLTSDREKIIFLINSGDEDMQKKKEISELSSRVQWRELGDDSSGWEDGNEDDGDELEARRKAIADAIAGEISNEHLHAPVYLGFKASNPDPPRPDTPTGDSQRQNSYNLEAPLNSYEPLDHSYSDDEEQEEMQSNLVAISAPISEDPESLHNVKARSLLRNELVLNDGGENQEDGHLLPGEVEGLMNDPVFTD
jgi:hypothetical protein